MIFFRKMFKVLSWNAVTMWVFKNLADICSICKNPLRETCLICQANPENNAVDKCRKVLGQCNHSFHSHCIEEWIKKQNNCPLCYGEWIAMKFYD